MKKKTKSKILVDTSTIHLLVHNQKMALISKMIIGGYTKQECIDFIMENFKGKDGELPTFDAAYTMWRQSFAFIYQQSNLEKEEIRKLNLSRLEQIYDEAMECNARITDKLKTIDLMNKTANLYAQEMNINQGDNTFKFDLNLNPGGEQDSSENKPEE